MTKNSLGGYPRINKHKYSTLVTRDIVCHLCNKEVWHEVDVESFSNSDEMGRKVR